MTFDQEKTHQCIKQLHVQKCLVVWDPVYLETTIRVHVVPNAVTWTYCIITKTKQKKNLQEVGILYSQSHCLLLKVIQSL